MSKKWIISLSIIFSILAVVLILFWTLFGLSSVTVEFDSTLQNLTVSEQEILDAGEFKYHSCVLFDGKKKYIQKIEDKAFENPNFAYLRVVNVETRFPNKYIVHVTEREQLFAIENNGQVLICDRDLRVLKIEDSFVSVQSNPILVQGAKILTQDVKVGDFLEIKQQSLKKVYSAFLKSNRDFSQIVGKFKSFKLGTCVAEITGKEYVSLTMTTFSDKTFVINNIDFALNQKISLALSVEASVYAQTFDENGNVINKSGENIFVIANERGEYVPFEEGMDESKKEKLGLENMKTILVDNLVITDHTPRTEKDIYYCFLKTT